MKQSAYSWHSVVVCQHGCRRCCCLHHCCRRLMNGGCQNCENSFCTALKLSCAESWCSRSFDRLSTSWWVGMEFGCEHSREDTEVPMSGFCSTSHQSPQALVFFVLTPMFGPPTPASTQPTRDTELSPILGTVKPTRHVIYYNTGVPDPIILQVRHGCSYLLIATSTSFNGE